MSLHDEPQIACTPENVEHFRNRAPRSVCDDFGIEALADDRGHDQHEPRISRQGAQPFQDGFAQGERQVRGRAADRVGDQLFREERVAFGEMTRVLQRIARKPWISLCDFTEPFVHLAGVKAFDARLIDRALACDLCDYRHQPVIAVEFIGAMRHDQEER